MSNGCPRKGSAPAVCTTHPSGCAPAPVALVLIRTRRPRLAQSRSSSMSALSPASVLGMPRSAARLSAVASSRRIRPATASFVSGGTCSCSELLQAGLLVLQPQPSGYRAGARGCRRRGSPAPASTRAPAATAARADRRRLASSKLARRFAEARTSRRIRRSSQASTDSWAPSRVSMAAMASPSRITTRSIPAHLTRLGADAEPPGRPDQGEGGLGARTGHLQGHRAARFGERTMGEEGATPRGHRDVQATADHLHRQTPHGTSARVDEAGLAGQRLPVPDQADDVAGAAPQPGCR